MPGIRCNVSQAGAVVSVSESKYNGLSHDYTIYILCLYRFNPLSPLQADLKGRSGAVSLDEDWIWSFQSSTEFQL